MSDPITYTAVICKKHRVVGEHDPDVTKKIVTAVDFSSQDEPGRRCAIKFNPGGHKPTEDIKLLIAAAMQRVCLARDEENLPEDDSPLGVEHTDSQQELDGYQDAMRCYDAALDYLEAAQMFAVKGLHALKNAQ